ncbi:hypothetical protein YC2023_073707 [Brassica napus]
MSQRRLITRGPLGWEAAIALARRAHTTLQTPEIPTTASLERLLSFTVWKQAVGKRHKPATNQVGRLDETQRNTANIFGQP